MPNSRFACSPPLRTVHNVVSTKSLVRLLRRAGCVMRSGQASTIVPWNRLNPRQRGQLLWHSHDAYSPVKADPTREIARVPDESRTVMSSVKNTSATRKRAATTCTQTARSRQKEVCASLVTIQTIVQL